MIFAPIILKQYNISYMIMKCVVDSRRIGTIFPVVIVES